MKITKGIIFILLSVSLSAFSQTTKIKELELKRKAALIEIENTNKLLLDTRKTTSNLLSRIKLISTQIISRQKVVSLLNEEVNSISIEQKKIEEEIQQLEANLKEEQKSYAVAIEGMIYKKQSKNKLIFILSGKTFGESVRRMKYLKEYSEWRDQQAESIKKQQKELADKKIALENTKKDKIALLTQRKSEEFSLHKEEETHQQEMGEAKKKQKELQEILSKKQKQANALNSQIERLIAEEVARQQREAKRIAEEKARLERERNSASKATKPGSKEPATTAPTETKPEMTSPTETKESFVLSNNFASNKGKFPMPVTGRYTIINGFGTHQHKQWNVTTNNNGIDIQAQSGSEARTIFQGEISKVMAFPGFNNCIIIRHGNYYTFYGNIQQVYVKQGQQVSAGQSIGKVYTDSDSGGSQLHFQLWNGTTKLNPELWLKK